MIEYGTQSRQNGRMDLGRIHRPGGSLTGCQWSPGSAGSAKFAYWHLGTLAIGFLFSWEFIWEYLTAEQKAWIRGILHRLWISSKKVAKTILDHSRDRLATFRSLLTNNHPKIQTEP